MPEERSKTETTASKQKQQRISDQQKRAKEPNLTQRIAQLEGETHRHASLNNILRAHLDDAINEQQRLQTELTQQKTIADRLQCIADKNEALWLKQQIERKDKLLTEYGSKTDKLEKKVKSTTKELAQITQNLMAKQTENETLYKCINLHNKANTLLKNQVQQKEQQIKELTAQNAKLTTQVKSLTEKILELTSQNAALALTRKTKEPTSQTTEKNTVAKDSSQEDPTTQPEQAWTDYSPASSAQATGPQTLFFDPELERKLLAEFDTATLEDPTDYALFDME
jgi:chromosome segregation ATPase